MGDSRLEREPLYLNTTLVKEESGKPITLATIMNTYQPQYLNYSISKTSTSTLKGESTKLMHGHQDPQHEPKIMSGLSHIQLSIIDQC